MNNGTRADRFAAMTAPRTVAAALASLFFIALLLRNPDIPIKYVSRGLTLCTTAVIPTLFPFMALSELLVRTGGGELMGLCCAARCTRCSGCRERGAARISSVRYAAFP